MSVIYVSRKEGPDLEFCIEKINPGYYLIKGLFVSFNFKVYQDTTVTLTINAGSLFHAGTTFVNLKEGITKQMKDLYPEEFI